MQDTSQQVLQARDGFARDGFAQTIFCKMFDHFGL